MSEAPKSNYTLPVLLALFLCIGLWLGSELSKPINSFGGSNADEVQKLEDILRLLDERYVDKINKDSIFESTISEMLHKLDPHSNYIAAKDMKAVNESINAKFGGIGVRFLLLRDTICVSNVMENSPSLIAGVKSGDKIIEVDGKKMTGKKITNDKVMSSLKGDEGTFVKVKVLRKNEKIDIKIIENVFVCYLICYLILNTTSFIKTLSKFDVYF